MFEVPTSLSPSRVEQFTSCPLAFRFASIERLPERPSIHATRGSLVHRALELAYMRPADERVPAAFEQALTAAREDWKKARALGQAASYWQQDDTGRWEKKA